MCLFKSYKATKKRKRNVLSNVFYNPVTQKQASQIFLFLNSKWLTSQSLMWADAVPVAIMANNHIIAFRKLATVCLW